MTGMNRFAWLTGLSCAVALAIAGCSKTPSQTSNTSNNGSATGGQDDSAATNGQSGTDNSAAGDQSPPVDSITAAMAKLAPDDRLIAEEQKVCPVSDKELGSMDVPIKVTVKGKTVFLCCEGCKDEIEKDPDKYLAKLQQAEDQRNKATNQ